MIEVFKTDVYSQDEADLLLQCIHTKFCEYRANFDLQDCDNILRIESVTHQVDAHGVINQLAKLGFKASVLSNEPKQYLHHVCSLIDNQCEE